MNAELTAQQKLFVASGLRPGDTVINILTGEAGRLYLSKLGYACVRTVDRAVIWSAEFRKEL